MLTPTASITSGIGGFMPHSFVSFVVWMQRWDRATTARSRRRDASAAL